MALIYKAELTPGKLDLIADWLTSRSWFADQGPLVKVATFRFDDPAGEVGIETFVVGSGDRLFHVPLTYRAAPLPDGALVGELEHSVLGHRWVYDAVSDPVYVSVTTQTIVSAGHDAEMLAVDGTLLPRNESIARVTGSGVPAGVAAGALTIARALPAVDVPAGAATLDASWGDTTVTLAWLV